MLDIRTFDARAGGNVLYKALAHPVAAEALARLLAHLPRPFALYDPDGAARTLLALYPDFRPEAGLFVHDTERVGEEMAGVQAQALLDLPQSGARIVLAVSFEDEKMRARLAHLRCDLAVETLAPARLPDNMLGDARRYLDRLNFATNFALFRDDATFGTRIVTANYWSNYGASAMRYWMRLFAASGAVLAQWEEAIDQPGQGIVIDSAEIRARFGLPEFCGQLFIHAIGARGHDVVKYALDTIGRNGNPSLSVTHDANAWPSDRYATLPAPGAGEQVVLWVQNSHAEPIAAGALSISRMGHDDLYPITQDVPGFGSVAIDVSDIVPDVAWPAQLELRAGHHMVRPRYEVIAEGRRRIAHLNVERADLRPDPAIRAMPEALGRGFLLPFPVLDPSVFRTIVQPTPMSEHLSSLPLRLDLFGRDGQLVGQKFLGNLPRDHDIALDLEDIGAVAGHAELVHDFRDGGEADGWLHALIRYRHRASGHAAETSFGAHVFNTLMTWRSEPQSYSGPPPGLSTRLFLKLGDSTSRRSFCCLIYPASVSGLPPSKTVLQLHGADGVLLAEEPVTIAASGSFMLHPEDVFGAERIEVAGIGGYVLIRDATCRLFGYHGVADGQGGFSLDHMFGF